MDVLAYSAFNQQVQLNQQIVAKTSCLSTKCSETAALQAVAVGFSTATICWLQCIEPCLLRDPYNGYVSGYWSSIPSLTGASTGFKVCDVNSQFNCGACCAWTVPAGVTRARFQLWGAGGGSGAGCCCGGSPFGSTGAYASVIIPVTAGDTYTLCSGCAMCCCATAGSSGNNASGCPSFVVGIGLTNFCAQGGEASLYCQLLTRCVSGAPSGYCMFLGGCICANNSVCWTANEHTGVPACCFDNMFPMISSCKTYFGTATCGTVYGIRGSFGSIAVNCNGTIRVQDAPVYGFPSVSCCCCIHANSAVSGWCLSAIAGYRQYPGGGGSAVFRCGGSTSYAGDSGRMGMVCVSYL